jgi:energy-coupling factor transporter ATP-binding protein EcfA2
VLALQKSYQISAQSRFSMGEIPVNIPLVDVKPEALKKLRLVINENLRVQRGGAEIVPYIDVSNALSDIAARQNHAVFGRRGCGKTLLLHYSAGLLPPDIRPVYLNCEDFKKHSFPNVLIEILDALFAELQGRLTGWFGKKALARTHHPDPRRPERAERKGRPTRYRNP